MTDVAPATGEASLWELFDPSHRANPYPAYKRWREATPIWEAADGLIVLSRHAECAAALRDARLGHADDQFLAASQAHREPGATLLVDTDSIAFRSFLFLNPPDHTRLRRLVAKAFTPSRVEELTPRIEQFTEELLEPLRAGATEIDLIGAFASPLPVRVISDLLGIPLEDRPRLVEWSHAMARGLDPAFLVPADLRSWQEVAQLEFSEYIRYLAARRRGAPGDDLLSALVAVRDQGDTLTEDELVATCILLLAAGHETTVNLLGNGMLALLRQPDQLDLLRRQPELMVNAVEELLRYDSPVQLTGRVALADTELRGIPVPAGSFLLMLVGAANRDPEAHPDPDRLDVSRQPTRHLAFGQGIHFCLGAPLARLEAQIGFRALVQHLGELSLDGELSWKDNVVLRGLQSLPVRCARAA